MSTIVLEASLLQQPRKPLANVRETRLFATVEYAFPQVSSRLEPPNYDGPKVHDVPSSLDVQLTNVPCNLVCT
jgi:hypothetical protein